MKLSVLGCSGSLPGPSGPASSYLLEHAGTRVLIDLGAGAFGPLQAVADPAGIDAVVLSHLHPDHCIDMCAYAVYLQHGPGRGARPIPVLAPAGADRRLANAAQPDAGEPEPLDCFAFSDLTASQSVQIGAVTITTAPMNHPVPTFALRAEAGGSVVTYSADTGETDELPALARDSDLLLCEASFSPADPWVPDLHLSGVLAGRYAQQAGVGRLLLTHIPPWADGPGILGDAVAEFSGPTELVAAGANYRLP